MWSVLSLRQLDDSCCRQVSTCAILGQHMLAINVSSRDDALATEQPQYCAPREYSVAPASAATTRSQCVDQIRPLDQVSELQHFRPQYGIASPESRPQTQGETACIPITLVLTLPLAFTMPLNPASGPYRKILIGNWGMMYTKR
jgi:hypothetical protein